MSERGLFITFEGGEGAGKTTQIKRLAASLGDCVLTREPGGTPEAEAVRAMFFSTDGQNWPPEALVLLMFSARVLHTEHLIVPALTSGKTVLCDRYTDSTRVYQGHAGRLAPEKIEAIKELSIGDFEPDLTFILDIAPEEGLRRAKSRAGETSFESKDVAFHQTIRNGFLTIAEENPERCIVIDAAKGEDEIASMILAAVENHRACSGYTGSGVACPVSPGGRDDGSDV